MGDALSEEQIVELKETFCVYDKDGDGCITVEELVTVEWSMDQNPTQEELHEMMKEVVPEGNGAIEIAEFLNLMAQTMEETNAEEEVREAFKVFNKEQIAHISY